ncbi:MAG: TraR/DksA C4-type zinc finger protein [Gemmataceae bacterium]|nr:TraR/DksA C4-type zinc finger protein [Gemmataceae bacterium]
MRTCQRCGNDIPAERLEALPDTTICVKCSQEIGGEFVYGAVPSNIGKAGSLKKNYGEWKIIKRRRRIEPKAR